MCTKIILYPNLHYTPVTDTLPDGTLVAFDPVTELWSTLHSGIIYRRTKSGQWIKKYISIWEKYVRKPNNHSRYPNLKAKGRTVDAHAVTARAWLGPVYEGYQIDHIDGNNRNRDISNLRLIPIWMNHRDGGFLNKLRNKGINPTYYAAPILLRFFERMADYKSSHSLYRYNLLSRTDLLNMLVNPEFTVGEPLDTAAEPNKYYDPFIERD